MKVKQINLAILDWLLDFNVTEQSEIGDADVIAKKAQVSLLDWMQACRCDKVLENTEIDFPADYSTLSIQSFFESIKTVWASIPEVYLADFKPLYLAIDELAWEVEVCQ